MLPHRKAAGTAVRDTALDDAVLAAPRQIYDKGQCAGAQGGLLASEISAGLQTFAFDSFRAWVGDELNGFDARAEIRPGDPAWSDDVAIAHWLHQTAISL